MNKKYKRYTPAILRWGISLVFLWFGFNQLTDASVWTIFLPSFASSLPFSLETLIMINGTFEIIFGILLIIGLFTRIVAFILAIHLAGISYTLGFNAIGIRDFGLTIATLSIALNGPDRFSLDAKLKNKKR